MERQGADKMPNGQRRNPTSSMASMASTAFAPQQKNTLHHNRENQPRVIQLKLPTRNATLIVGVVIVLICVALFMYNLGKTGSSSTTSNSSIASNPSGNTSEQPSPAGDKVSIPVYYPKNLPTGFTYNNDAKALKPDVLYYSIKGPGSQNFYVTQQAIPANFDFAAFNKKFLKPDSFSTEAGTATAGVAGPSLVGSIRTTKNTWIIINSLDTSVLPQLETVARSLQLAR